MNFLDKDTLFAAKQLCNLLDFKLFNSRLLLLQGSSFLAPKVDRLIGNRQLVQNFVDFYKVALKPEICLHLPENIESSSESSSSNDI
uniref:Uncharacterized protein n=1 Tax=Romanomermis culicivorax TaxID=13658 RepID=A0A915JEU6_ROMCU